MKIIQNFTAAEILAISADAPERLFSGDLSTAKAEYRALSRMWHPDHNPAATHVFQHITSLYKKAQELIENDAWRGRGILTLSSSDDGKTRTIHYHKKIPFELGEMYVGQSEIVFGVGRGYSDLFANAGIQFQKFTFANARMKTEIERYLPHNPEYYSTGFELFMVLPKSPDLILLEDLRVHLGGAIDPKHVAWIQSSLHNLSCYFAYSGIAHNDISPQTYFISPENHYGVLLGGWWYARKIGEKISALPSRTMKLAPPDVVRKKIADGRVDLELIRATGRELLGDAAGASLRMKKDVPAALANWLNGATTGKAVTDYELWSHVLEQSFGERRFVKLEVDTNAVYG